MIVLLSFEINSRLFFLDIIASFTFDANVKLPFSKDCQNKKKKSDYTPLSWSTPLSRGYGSFFGVVSDYAALLKPPKIANNCKGLYLI